MASFGGRAALAINKTLMVQSSLPSLPTGLVPRNQQQQVQVVRGMATKKQGGSSSNGRDSAGRRLGIKLYPGQRAKAGSIVIRQRGAKFRPDHLGGSTHIGKDHTIFATQPGIVHFEKHPHHKKKRHVVSIVEPQQFKQIIIAKQQAKKQQQEARNGV